MAAPAAEAQRLGERARGLRPALPLTVAEYLGRAGSEAEAAARWPEVAADVPRSFSALPAELRPAPDARPPCERSLSRVVLAWLERSEMEDLETGYVQGMGYVGAMAVRCCGHTAAEAEDAALALTAAILELVLTPALFARWPSLVGASAAACVVAERCSKFFPPAKLPPESLADCCELLVTRWLLTGFVSALPLAPLAAIWESALGAVDEEAQQPLAGPLGPAGAAAPPFAASGAGGGALCGERARRLRRRGSLALGRLLCQTCAIAEHCAPAATAEACEGAEGHFPIHEICRLLAAAAESLPLSAVRDAPLLTPGLAPTAAMAPPPRLGSFGSAQQLSARRGSDSGAVAEDPPKQVLQRYDAELAERRRAAADEEDGGTAAQGGSQRVESPTSEAGKDGDDAGAVLQSHLAETSSAIAGQCRAVSVTCCSNRSCNGVYLLWEGRECNGRRVWRRAADEAGPPPRLLFWSSKNHKWYISNIEEDKGWDSCRGDTDTPVGLTGWQKGACVDAADPLAAGVFTYEEWVAALPRALAGGARELEQRRLGVFRAAVQQARQASAGVALAPDSPGSSSHAGPFGMIEGILPPLLRALGIAVRS
eukprot:TRINITY_DN66036_c0_g1_i1.p1 TRINITY_DN66036_c0_g1~~TRINITY_DN66036_c0_g1_i1.p1  ORF type:complete len:599 (+),score=174.16 TRINITY_DN66036_c0_g1_i1:83-1879(+)